MNTYSCIERIVTDLAGARKRESGGRQARAIRRAKKAVYRRKKPVFADGDQFALSRDHGTLCPEEQKTVRHISFSHCIHAHQCGY
jgi:hypothetical protein